MNKRAADAVLQEPPSKHQKVNTTDTKQPPPPPPPPAAAAAAVTETGSEEWRFRTVCPKVRAWPEVADGACGICLQPIGENEPLPDGKQMLIRNYSGHNFTTSDPPMAQSRVYRPFCYACWSKHYTPAIVVDGFRRYFLNHYSTLHVVCNWQNVEDIKMQRTSGKIDQKCKLVTQYFDDTEKQVSFINFNTFLGEPMVYLWTDDPYVSKCLYLSDIQKLNPHLPPFQWRFPNRIPFHQIIQWLNKPPYPRKNNASADGSTIDGGSEFRDLHKLFYLSEWYNPDI
jgi:hypothetical protein